MKVFPDIPFLAFEERLASRIPEYEVAISHVLRSGNFILGKYVADFEERFSEYLGGGQAIGVGNGTDALEISISSLGLDYGSKIATVANAGGYATVAILKNRMQPIYMDVEIKSRNVLISEVERVVAEGVKAIIITHLYGNIVSEIKEIVSLCHSKGIFVIEDASQAHGAQLNGISAGRFGDLSAFSLYPSKNLGAIGDAGIILVNNSKLVESTRKLRTYGWVDKYDIRLPNGRNSRLDEIQAAVLSVNLKYLEGDNKARSVIAMEYSKTIRNEKLIVPKFNETSHVYHLYTIITPHRDLLVAHLKQNGINSAIHFPIPDYAQAGIHSKSEKLPNTEYLCSSILSLPCYPELKPAIQNRICDALSEF